MFHRELKNWGAQRNWGLNQCQHPWVLVVDCDEILSARLFGIFGGMEKFKIQRKRALFL